jgi:hypothetical protein
MLSWYILTNLTQSVRLNLNYYNFMT